MADNGNPSPVTGCTSECYRMQLYQAIVFAAPVLFASMLLLLFCLLYIKRRRVANIHSPMQGQIFGEELFESSSCECGLSKSFRLSLPILQYDEELASTCDDAQCSVCLSDYQMGEKIQMLPACKHVFHMQCIDKWLANNVTCPICRTSILPHDGSCLIDNAQFEATGSGLWLWEERIVNEAQGPRNFERSNRTSDDIEALDFVIVSNEGHEPASNMERS
ncbi:hypothetical protein KP509_18G040500 [Ceratopteris richardii]|uniref:RING-type E3 ubiquitin transferase n=1 Tax=Ceratopteris richardii TaxID=49495 RepID=A0A8T2SR36_CERRI|nr:hypothetical protein KP509_18G040500 [Ceratopteris richardii]KAH7365667.1 hypothetical protein KP509_18G040500 [Ceratopteris richardii]